MTQAQALEILKTGVNVFLTGEPGSGKTYTVNSYVAFLRKNGIIPAITASTGIAATHIGGVTIHSWAGIGIREEMSAHELRKLAGQKKAQNRMQDADVLIIDEVSMLSTKALTLIDAACRAVRKNDAPFGGMQVVLVGDFFQLPPVTKGSKASSPKEFAFNAPVWAEARFAVCYLTEQHRQDDSDFFEVLAAIRSNKLEEKHLARIHGRIAEHAEVAIEVPRLFSHNVSVDQMNDERLDALRGEAQEFRMNMYGKHKLIEILKKGCLSPELLRLKIGAVVMFTKNDPTGRFSNGTLGVVKRFDTEGYPVVEIRGRKKIHVERMDWKYDSNDDHASIVQFPLRLAWAITIHKSQGMSMDAAVMDLSDVFEYGQGYVALSRVRRFSGLYLNGVNKLALQVDAGILEKDVQFRASSEAAVKRLAVIAGKELRAKQEAFLERAGD